MTHGYLGEWRTHQARDRQGRLQPKAFDYCQRWDCPEAHFVSSFAGTRPVTDEWDHLLDSDGKIGK